MNPTTASSQSELKGSNFTCHSDNQSLASNSTITSTRVSLDPQRPQSYNASIGLQYHDTLASSFTPSSAVNTIDTEEFSEYFGTSAVPAFNPSSGLDSHHEIQQAYASLVTETDFYSGRQSQSHHLPYITSAPSLQCFIGGLTNKLPDLRCTGSCGDSGMDISHMTPRMVAMASPAYSPSSVTTQSSGSVCKRAGGDMDNKSGASNSRSKKESHNRIERRRRDYINSQIARLGGLLPPGMYRDVDGRRNKGTVLRLSVNYILELRQAVTNAVDLQQETTLARYLIPLLLNHIQVLENIIKEVELSSGKPLGSDGNTTCLFLENTHPPETAFNGALDAWRNAMTTNSARTAALGAKINNDTEAVSQEDTCRENTNPPSMNNTQGALVRRPGDLAPVTNAVGSPYLPNSFLMRGPVCKLEDGAEGCYGNINGDSHCGPYPHPIGDTTTDGYFHSTRDGNHIPKFEVVQLTNAGCAPDCRDSIRVECQNH